MSGFSGLDPSGWLAYTPTVTSQGGTITTASATGKYKQFGKTVFLTTTTTVTTAGTGTGYLQVSLPGGMTSATGGCMGCAFDANGGTSGAAQILGGTTIMKAVNYIGATFIANGATVTMSCTFETT